MLTIEAGETISVLGRKTPGAPRELDVYKDIVQELQHERIAATAGVHTAQSETPAFDWAAIKKVGSQLGAGMADEICHHPRTLLFNAGLGFEFGVGAAFVGPYVSAAVGLIGAGVAGYQLYRKLPAWRRDARIVGQPD